MQTKKVLRRIARTNDRPELFERIARDVGVALARGQRDDLATVVRELAVHAPAPPAPKPGDRDHATAYWSGFAAALGTLLTAYEAAHHDGDAREFARRVVAGASAESVILALAEKPATGAELARELGLTPGATSKILKSLRQAGLARIPGPPDGTRIPERGARKIHRLTSLGLSIAEEFAAANHRGEKGLEAAVR